jgi:hypothetical protein
MPLGAPRTAARRLGNWRERVECVPYLAAAMTGMDQGGLLELPRCGIEWAADEPAPARSDWFAG